MGINGFFKIRVTSQNKSKTGSKNKSKDVQIIAEKGKLVKLTDFKGENICIDASLIIYNSILAVHDLHTLTDSEGRPTAHINTIFNKVIQLEECGINQMWIFDSPEPNKLKSSALAKRAERRELAVKKEYKNQEKIQYKLNGTDVTNIQNLLEKMGIMYIESPSGIEAEQYGAYLTKGPESDRFCKYMISGDSDVLCFGGNLLRITSRVSETGKSKKTIYQAFDLEDLLRDIDMSYEKFLEIVALGSDFNLKSDGVGPVTVLNKIRKGEIVLTPRQEMAIKYYKSDISSQIGSAKITQGEYDKEAVIELLKKHNFNEERIRKRLEKYKIKN
jgi:5'-3' exonuclease